MINDIWQYFGLEFVYINAYATVYQNIPHGSRDMASFTIFLIWISGSAKPRQMTYGI